MRLFRKAVAAALSMALMLSAAGCGSGTIYSNYREIEEMQVIQTLGVDADDRNGEILVSAATGMPANASAPILLNAAGPSVTIAMTALQDYASSEYLFYAHTRFFVLGEDAAKRGIYQYLDYLERAPEIRLGTDLFVVRGNTANALITGAGGEGADYDVTDLLSAAYYDAPMHGISFVLSGTDVTKNLAENGSSLICAIDCAEAKNVIASGGGGLSALPVGFGIIKDGYLIDYLTGPGAKGACLLMNEMSGGYVILKMHNGAEITLNIDSGKTKYKPRWNDDGTVKGVDIECGVNAALVELTDPLGINTEEFFDMMDEALSQMMLEFVTAALDKSREHCADFLGIGGRLEASSPVNFDKYDKQWPKALTDITFTVSMDARVLRAYDMLGTAAADRHPDSNGT